MYFTLSMNAQAYAAFLVSQGTSQHIKNHSQIDANNSVFNTPAAEFTCTYEPTTNLLYVTPRTTAGPAVLQTTGAAEAYFTSALLPY